MSVEELEVTISAYLRKVKKAGVGDIIANCLAGSDGTHSEMYRALAKLRKSGKLKWLNEENKHSFVEKKNVTADKRKTTKSKSAK